MTTADATDRKVGDAALRRAPVQRRSQERVERMLATAIGLIGERGLDGVRMSDVAELAGVSIGSLYQYFPDKAAIVRSLADRYNAEGRACVAKILDEVRSGDALRPALIAIADGFFDMYRRHPAMRAIWQAMQGDAALQAIDAEDDAHYARAFSDTIARIDPYGDPARRDMLAALLMNQLCAAVRFAIGFDAAAGDAAMALYKRTLPQAPLDLLTPDSA